jgi:hypothetical protein
MRQRIFLVSIGVCVFVGVPLGTVAFGVLTGAPLLPFETDIAGVPVLVYAFISGGPVAVVAGMVGGGVLLRLLRSNTRIRTWSGWILTCAGAGTCLSVGLALALAAAGSVEKERLFPMVTFLGITGGFCGALLGLYGWNVKRRIDDEFRLAGTQ